MLAPRSSRSAAALAALPCLLVAACEGGSGPPAGGSSGSSSVPATAGVEGSPSSKGPSAESGLPGLACDAPSFDFGTIWEGESVEHTFELVARGPGPVRVEAVRATCGCTLPRLERGDGTPFAEGQALEPGETLALEVVFQSLHRVGSHDRPITLYGNVSESGRFQVSLVGEVRPRLEAAEEVADFGKLLGDEGQTAAIELATADGEPVLLLPPRPPGPYEVSTWPADLAVDLVPQEPDDRGRAVRWTAHLALAPGGDPGAFHWPVRIEIADDDAEYTGTGATVYARWQRVRPLEATPPTLALGVLRQGVLASGSVRLVANATGVDPTALDAAGATVTAQVQGRDVSEHLSVVLRPGEEPGQAVLELVADGLPAELAGPLRGQVILPVGRPDQETLTIWIDGIIAAG